MKAKEYLSQAIWLDRIINNKLEQKEKLEALAERVTADFSRERVSGGMGATSPMEDVTVKLIDLGNEINADIDRLLELKKEILSVINKIRDYRYRLILEMRYINGKSWDDVAIETGYDIRTIFRLHGKALDKIDEILKKGTEKQQLSMKKKE